MAWLLVKAFGRVVVSVAATIVVVAASLVLGTFLGTTVADWEWLPGWVTTLASWLGEPPPTGMNYQAIITAAIAVSGSLAGVYFATVAFVVSTTYKDATPKVRALVTRLPGGRVYASVYIQAVLFGLIMLTLPMLGREPNRLQLCLVTVLGGFVVLSFGRLRTQLFGLIEPTRLLAMVQADIARWTTEASRLSGRDSTGLRTRLSRIRTLESLHTLRDLCYLIRDRERSSTNVPAEYAGTDPRVVSTARAVRVIWLRYAERKFSLISLPGWCPPRPTHKDWLLASDSEIGTALATNTTLHAVPTDDVLWVERHLAETLGELVGGREATQLVSILDSLEDPVRPLVAHGMFAEARVWMDAVVAPARTVTTPSSQSLEDAEVAPGVSTLGSVNVGTSTLEGHLYNLVDYVGLAHTQAVLGLHDYARMVATDLPEWIIAEARGKKVQRLGPLPTKVLSNIRDGLAFEKSVEGKRVTSDANIRQLVARDIATEALDEASALMAVFEETYWPWVIRVIDGGTTVAGAALSRLDEALHKWDHPLSALRALFEQCEALHRDVDDRWPDLKLDDLKARRAALRDLLRTPIAKVATHVDIDMNSDRPDVFGWAFFRAHQDFLDDVLLDPMPVREDLEERLRLLFNATDRASARLRASVRRQHISVLGSFWSEPMLMLLQLSGAALVIGHARKMPDLLGIFERVWGEFLDKNAQHLLDLALAVLAMDDSLMGISNGKINRSRRHLQTVAALESLGLSSEDLEDAELGQPPSGVSAKIAVMLRVISFGHLEEVFVAAWLVPAALRRGAALPPKGLAPRLADLIAEFGVTTDTQQDQAVG